MFTAAPLAAAPSAYLDGREAEHDPLLAIYIGVEDAENVNKVVGNYETLRKTGDNTDTIIRLLKEEIKRDAIST